MRLILLLAMAVLVVPALATHSASAAPSTCFSKLDDMINDGGTTYCVNHDGCLLWESTEYIWGRESRCVVP